MNDPRVIGHVVSINGFRVKVELLDEARSPTRTTLDGARRAVTINGYIVFNIGAGHYALGIITDLEARESYDPSNGDELSLQLSKPRRTASVQLLGTVQAGAKDIWEFDTGITILPPLDVAAEIADPVMLAAAFSRPPVRNKPEEVSDGRAYDFDLELGYPTGDPNTRLKASYNDLFSRPLAVVGNTGSGKSYSVASLLQKAMKSLDATSSVEPHIFILDINGEYSRAFDFKPYDRLPDRVYLNGQEFSIPIWMFNSMEICAWLSASEQTQEPVLKDWWAVAKFDQSKIDVDQKTTSLRHARTKISELLAGLNGNGPKRKNSFVLFSVFQDYCEGYTSDLVTKLKAAMEDHKAAKDTDWSALLNEKAVREITEALVQELNAEISDEISYFERNASTADSPLPIRLQQLVDPSMADRAVTQEDLGRIESHLTTLKLRLRTRREDKRWQAFLNYERFPTKIENLDSWLSKMSIGLKGNARISVIDLSMLAGETLPYACAVIGRILLEARERLPSEKRFQTPWVLVLEEAHNYARPAKADEDRGQKLSRFAFERIAKEGRKFGFSLIVASQRPSEISPTIISQCANFMSHRLQNPDDIDHFRRIIPLQARRLLDQVTVLASGEAIVFGSAFHVPSRVKIDMPSPPPWSQTAAPYYEWNKPNSYFPVTSVLENWGLRTKNDGDVPE